PPCPASTTATRRRSTSSSAGSVATRSRTTPSARGGPSPRRSGGSRPTSATTPRTDMLAVLWDMDGTLVDTEPYWMATEVDLAEEYGATWTTADAEHLIGNSLLTS